MRTHMLPAKARVDADGDTVMATTNIRGYRGKDNRDHKGFKGKQRAKWVDTAEREKRREKGLCFRCGAAGHRISECPYRAAVRPTTINAVGVGPLLEDEFEIQDSVLLESGKD